MTLNDLLQQFFQAHPNEWIDGRKLETVAGAYAWRSRVSDLRLQRGMDIQNRCRRIPKLLVPGESVTISEYRYVTHEPLQPSFLENPIDNAEGQA